MWKQHLAHYLSSNKFAHTNGKQKNKQKQKKMGTVWRNQNGVTENIPFQNPTIKFKTVEE